MEDDDHSTLVMNSNTIISGKQENPVCTHPSSHEVDCSSPPAIQESGNTNILNGTIRQPLQALSAAERKARSRPEIKQIEKLTDLERKRATLSCMEDKENQSERLWKGMRWTQSAEYRDKAKKNQQVLKGENCSQSEDYRHKENEKQRVRMREKRSQSHYREMEKKKQQERRGRNALSQKIIDKKRMRNTFTVNAL